MAVFSSGHGVALELGAAFLIGCPVLTLLFYTREMNPVQGASVNIVSFSNRKQTKKRRPSE